MRLASCLALLLCAASLAAQTLPPGAWPAPKPEEVCVYRARPLEPGQVLQRTVLPWRAGEAGAPAQTATFDVTYNGFTPEAEAAFQYAVDIWARLLTSSVPIGINATFEPLFPGALGSAGSNGVFPVDVDGEISLYPSALADALTGVDQGMGSADIFASFSSTASWYFGLDGNPGLNEFDFVSVVLHELGHGLGFFGSADYGLGCIGGSEDSGCWGFGLEVPIIYDRFAEDAEGIPFLDTDAYPQNSTALGDLITGNNLFADGTLLSSTTEGRPRLFAPATFFGGSSFSHLNDATYAPGTENALMTPRISRGEVLQSPGPIVCRMFTEFGWTVDLEACDALTPPVEVERPAEPVGTYWLASPYPNPVRVSATVAFAIARPVPVRVEVYDVLGRPVQTLYDATPDADTPVRARLDATRLASGTYVVQITGEGFRETQRVTVVR
ncbi:MAG: T9SS type A sorting domain-containing protein [Bacteroidota bacterium]